MSIPTLDGFADLLPHLDALIAGAESADVDPLLVNVVRTVRRRLLIIQAYATGAEPDEPSPPPEPARVDSAEHLLERLKTLTEAATTRTLHPEVAGYLALGYQRVWNFHHHHEERRIAPRFPEERTAWLWVDGQAHPVRGLERSLIGFGVLAPLHLERERIVQLGFEPAGRGGEALYDCLVVYSFPEGDGYQVGLEVFGHSLPAPEAG